MRSIRLYYNVINPLVSEHSHTSEQSNSRSAKLNRNETKNKIPKSWNEKERGKIQRNSNSQSYSELVIYYDVCWLFEDVFIRFHFFEFYEIHTFHSPCSYSLALRRNRISVPINPIGCISFISSRIFPVSNGLCLSISFMKFEISMEEKVSGTLERTDPKKIKIMRRWVMENINRYTTLNQYAF